MEPQIIHYYNHKNILCKICGKKGHTSEYCPNVGMAKIGIREKKEEKVDDFTLYMDPITLSPKEKNDPIFSIISTESDDEFIIDEDFKMDDFHIPTKEIEQEDIDMVVNYTGVGRDVAEKLIRENRGDPVSAIMKLPLKKNPPYPEENDITCHDGPSTPPRKRGRKPKKEGNTYKFKNEKDAIGNSSDRDSYLPEKGYSDTAWNNYVKTIRNLEHEGLPPIPEKLFQ